MYSNNLYLPLLNNGLRQLYGMSQSPVPPQQSQPTGPTLIPAPGPSVPAPGAAVPAPANLGLQPTTHSLVLSHNSVMSQANNSSMSDQSSYRAPSPSQPPSTTSLNSAAPSFQQMPPEQLLSNQLGINALGAQNMMTNNMNYNLSMNPAMNMMNHPSMSANTPTNPVPFDYHYKQPTALPQHVGQFYHGNHPNPANSESQTTGGVPGSNQPYAMASKFSAQEIQILKQLLVTGEKFKWKQITKEINEEAKRRSGDTERIKNVSPTFVIKQYQSLLGLPNNQLYFGMLGSSLPYLVHGWDAVNEVD